jgi:hypothetical protein
MAMRDSGWERFVCSSGRSVQWEEGTASRVAKLELLAGKNRPVHRPGRADGRKRKAERTVRTNDCVNSVR